MKIQKYKCIKLYPGGPSIGMTIEPVKAAWQGLSYWINNNYFNPEDYKEYWEKVVEKDYGILSFVHDGSNGIQRGYIVNMRNGRLDAIRQFLPESHYLNSTCWKINSVKRLSDGEIFTIGDKVNETVTGKKDSWTIKEFSLKDSRCFSCGINVGNIEFNKDPLFVTEDGVDYYNESNWVWDTHDYSSNSPAIFSNPGFLTQTEVKWAKDLKRKFFSTKEAAEKYKEENKPQYSKRDMLSFTRYCGFHYEDVDRYFDDYIKKLKK